LVTLDHDLQVTSIAQIGHDLRDVVFTKGMVVVSRFRSAEVLGVDIAQGRTLAPMRPANYVSFNFGRTFEPAVAWRMQKLPNGNVAIVHQRSLLDPVPSAGAVETGGES